ncbi:MAG TPA: PEPxxWA-CTERM sorting domain-containing protein, partial [Phenylobacterium sp.]|nr:PEPxxWA-CTERM sorting domain-containing protein [Phenylobacterium sp.]
VDRGAGTQFLHNLHVADPQNQPDVGVGVFFDAFIALTPTGGGNATGSVFLLNPSAQVVSMTNLAAGAVTINGDSISVDIPVSLLPSQGFDIAQYGYNLWPRITGISNNNQVSDFAPNESPLPSEGLPRRALFLATAVPEPGVWSLMIVGFGGIGLTLRRRRAIQAA